MEEKYFENLELVAQLLPQVSAQIRAAMGNIQLSLDLLQEKNVVLADGGEVALTTSYIYVFANILCGVTTVLPQLNLKKSAKASPF